jgi:hypothetical protein
VIRLARKLMLVADQGDQSAVDDTCRILFGIVRDCAHKVDGAARQELDVHSRRLPRGRAP